MDLILAAPTGQIDRRTHQAVVGLLRKAQADVFHNTEFAKRCIDAAADLLATGGHAAPADGSGGLAQWQVRRVEAMIESRSAAPLTNADLACATRLSTDHFSRAFRKTFGCPPHRYVLQRRIFRAKIMMSTSCEALSQIALECGFADQAHFGRIFRSIEGQSPNAWRRRMTTPNKNLAPE